VCGFVLRRAARPAVGRASGGGLGCRGPTAGKGANRRAYPSPPACPSPLGGCVSQAWTPHSSDHRIPREAPSPNRGW